MIRVLYSGNDLRERRRETILHPPQGVLYSTLVPISDMMPDYIISKTPQFNGAYKKSFLRAFAKYIIKVFSIPNIRWFPFWKLIGIDMIHTPGHLILNRRAYVVEVDNVACFAFYDLSILYKRKKIIERMLVSPYCKKILCISEAARKSVINTFIHETIARKCEVIYPYVEPRTHFASKEKNNKIIILTVNTKFYMKGTREVLRAFEKLIEKFNNIELWVVSNTPQEYIKRYKNNPSIKFFPATFSKEELHKRFFSRCDIFVQPSYQDSFGLVYLEVMSHGKPIVSTDLFAIPEMVIDGYNGFLISSPLYMYNSDFTLKKEYFPIKTHDTEELFYKGIDGSKVVFDLVEKLSILIHDEALRATMGHNALALIQTKFSEIKRKEKLFLIYKESVA